MLTIEIDTARLTRAQAAYREDDTLRGVHFGHRVRAFRLAFESLIERFAERQRAAAAAGRPHLADGRQATVIAEVLDPDGHAAWPRRAAAVLHGLRLPVPPILPQVFCREGGLPWRLLDSASYLAHLHDGPPEARSLGDTTALALYMAPLNTLRILWVGAEADAAEAAEALAAETAGWTDCAAVSPAFAARLKALCDG